MFLQKGHLQGGDVHAAGRPGQDSWESLLSFQFHWLVFKVVRYSLMHGQLICPPANHIRTQDDLERQFSLFHSLPYPFCGFLLLSLST